CFYGMRALLTLYLTKSLLLGDERAFAIYGAYTALVYAAPVWGGKLADAVLGYRRAIVFGGLVMAAGEFMILGGNDFWLFAGMGAIIIGNGYFKANISTIVGRLYQEGDPRRDAGFTIFYMGINLGSLLATLVVAPIGETRGYLLGFAIAGVGMLLAVGTFLMGAHLLEGHGEPRDPERYRRWSKPVYAVSLLAIPGIYALINWGTTVKILGQDLLFWILIGLLSFVCFTLLTEAFKSDRVQRDRILVLMILMVFNVVFWACFEQAGSSLTLFADRNVDRDVAGLFTMPASMTQFFNPAFILLLGSFFSVMWVRLSRAGRNPSIPMKFRLGIVQLGLGYLVLLVGAALAGDRALVPLFVLALMYLLHTTGELFLSPIGLSMVTKLAPRHLTGTVMGAWFLSFAFSNYLASVLARLTGGGEGVDMAALPPAESLAGYVDVFGSMGMITVGIGLGLVAISRFLNRMMHGVN
ncbi:MAG: peptide MFS transporter, partial [Candidatus Krumholzibacteriia bacterium]